MNALTHFFKDTSKLHAVAGMSIVLMGILALVSPFITGVAASSLSAILLMAGGSVGCVLAFREDKFTHGLLKFGAGALAIVAGVFMFSTPVMSLAALTGILMAFFVVDGCYSLYVAYQLRKETSWGWTVFSGLCSIALAVLLYMDWPFSGLYAIGTLVGVRLIISGMTMVITGFFTHAVADNTETLLEEIEKEQVAEVESDTSANANA